VRVGLRLGTLLILFAAAALLLHSAAPVTGAVNPASVYAVPTSLGDWTSSDGVSEDVLPIDSSEKISVRRTYRHGDQVAWVSVALFVGQDNEIRRASVNRMYPARAVNWIEPVSLSAPLYGPGTSPVVLSAVVVQQEGHRLLVAYWHQIGRRAFGNEYSFRFALMRDMVVDRHADSMLVRIAIPAGPESQLSADLAVVERLAVDVYAALGGGR